MNLRVGFFFSFHHAIVYMLVLLNLINISISALDGSGKEANM